MGMAAHGSASPRNGKRALYISTERNRIYRYVLESISSTNEKLSRIVLEHKQLDKRKGDGPYRSAPRTNVNQATRSFDHYLKSSDYPLSS